MDPNHWPAFMWLAMALGFGSIITAFILFLWKAFRRTPGWILDSISLGICGFLLVIAMMAYIVITDGHLPKEVQKVLGYFVLVTMALVLLRASNGIKRRATHKKDVGAKND